MAKEKNLTAVTSVAAADFARVVTSAGASVKATFANVAKYIVETYNGSTVAGSAQSVKSALDSLNSKTLGQSFFGNLNSITDTGIFVLQAGCTNAPSSGISDYGGYLISFKASSSVTIQICLSTTGATVFERVGTQAWRTISLS